MDATILWMPTERPWGASDQTPSAQAVAVPSTLLPSSNLMTLPLSAVPASALLDVIRSDDDPPVSCTRPIVVTGAAVS